MNKSELEAKIYDTFYDENPEGDARTNGLWKAVIDCKDELALLEDVLNDVENGHYF